MKRFVLSELAGGRGSERDLLDEAMRLEKEKGKVYKTYVRVSSGPAFDLATTSKDTHLELGRLTAGSQYSLAMQFESLRQEHSVSAFLFQMAPNQGAALVTRAQEGGLVTFVIAPAH